MVCKKKLFIGVAFSLFIVGCQNASDQEQLKVESQKSIALPITCLKPAPVSDIWKLEPILVKQGKIVNTMTKKEKEKAIHAYISLKTKQYKICLKGNKQ